MTHEMKLPDGTTLREGDYAKLRNGEVVGPIEANDNDFWPFFLDTCLESDEGMAWRDDGTGCRYSPAAEYDTDLDIIAKATNPRTAKAVAQLDGKDDTPQLWRDMTPEQKSALLLAHHEGKVIEEFSFSHWGVSTPVKWIDSVAYRIKPEPRELWIVGGCEAYDSLQEAQDACSKLMWPGIVHVREVTE